MEKEPKNPPQDPFEQNFLTKKYKVKFSTIIRLARDYSYNEKEYSKCKLYANIALLAADIGLKSKIDILSYLSDIYYNSGNFLELLKCASKAEKLIQKDKNYEKRSALKIFFNAGHFLYENKMLFPAFKYLHKIKDLLSSQKHFEVIRKIETEILNDLKEKKNFYSNFTQLKDDYIFKIKHIIDESFVKEIKEDNVYLVSSKWMNKAKVFIDRYIKERKKGELGNDYLLEIYNANECLKLYLDYYKEDIEKCEKEKSGIFPGIIDNCPIIDFKFHWDDFENKENNIYLKKNLKYLVDYVLLKEEDWNELKNLFGAIIEVVWNNIELVDLNCFMISPEMKEDKNWGLVFPKHIQVNKKFTLLEFKEKILRIVQNVLNVKDVEKEKEMKKEDETKIEEDISMGNESKNEEPSQQTTLTSSEHKTITEEEKTSSKETTAQEKKDISNNNQSLSNEDPSKENSKDTTYKKPEDKKEETQYLHSPLLYNITFYILPKKFKPILFELTLSYLYRYPSITIPATKIEISEEETITKIPYNVKDHILIVEITKKDNDTHFINIQKTICLICGSKIDEIYYCPNCNYNIYCSKACSEKDKEHHKFEKLLSNYIRINFSLKKFLSIPMAKVIKENTRHGLVGLINFGSTCYLNSFLQCLSNTEDLLKYFLLGYFKEEISEGNSLGKGGYVAEVFNYTLENLWNTNQYIYEPRKFALTLEKIIKNIQINSQQDSQEVLSLFLDNLHEDLNRIIKKPYIELNEQQSNETDQEASNRWWNIHKKREDSIIVDLFHGQFKSSVLCLVCKNLNITYDPFIFLSLGIPSEVRIINIKYFYSLETKKGKKLYCKEFEKTIFINTNVLDIKEECLKIHINDKFDIKDKQLDAVLLDKEKIILKILSNEEHVLPYYEKSFEICIYERDLPEAENIIDIWFYPIISQSEQNITKKIVLMSYPIAIYAKYNDKIRVIYDNLLEKLSYFLDNLRIRNIPKDKILNIQIYHNFTNGFFINKNSCEFCNSTKSNSFCALFNNKFITLDSEIASIKEKVKNRVLVLLCSSLHFNISQKIYEGMEHIQLNKYKNNPLMKKIGTLTIYHVLDFFECDEKLEKENSWYCPKCKKFQEIRKKIEIYKPPRYLIVHFKRFKIKSNNMIMGMLANKKNTTFIQYPLEGLDLRKFIKGPEKNKGIYDLYGAILHVGWLSSGHYTATCKNLNKWVHYNDEKLSWAGNDDIVNENAYTLFYKRKDLDMD